VAADLVVILAILTMVVVLVVVTGPDQVEPGFIAVTEPMVVTMVPVVVVRATTTADPELVVQGYL
jgi:hypothetical protein